MAAEEKFDHDHLAYVRLRSPQQHATALNVPDAADVNEILRSNLALRSTYRESLTVFSALARHNVFEAAVEYTRKYLPEVDQWLPGISTDRVVMAGHQPTLFHPGVWYKNFRLDALATRFDAVAINLVVDNDLLSSPTIGCPVRSNAVRSNADASASVVLLRMDPPAAPLPYENRSILDAQCFKKFHQSATEAIDSVVANPMVSELWPEVMAAREILGDRSMGQVLAAGRHRLEWRLGLRTLEVPVSHVSGTQAFGSFVARIFIDIENFQKIYNRVLLRYRNEHGIRSSAHPVPELTGVDQWLETPFWIWTGVDPQRRRLFMKTDDRHFHLSDLNQFQRSVDIGEFPQWWSDNVKTGQVCIRPRALATTMFSRLLVCDLFIHGIGGAKYDQLTDQIISDFFDVSPPEYLTSTATFRLPLADDRVTKEDVSNRRQRLREYKFHPEKFVTPSAETDSLKQQKRSAIKALNSGDDKKSAHAKIEAVNQKLSKMLQHQAAATELEIEQLKSQLRRSQILHSREYSFALHPNSIVEELKTLARQ